MKTVTSEQINELAGALAKAQGEITGAVKDSSNPFFKSNYADLASVWDACRAQLSKNGLAVIQTTDESESGAVYLLTKLVHTSGQWVEGRLRINPQKNDPQAVGSAITYARRYALSALVGIPQVDDDAESAMDREPKINSVSSVKTTKVLSSVARPALKPALQGAKPSAPGGTVAPRQTAPTSTRQSAGAATRDPGGEQATDGEAVSDREFFP